MIAKIQGLLENVADDVALVRVGSRQPDPRGADRDPVVPPVDALGALIYETLLPAYTAARLRPDVGKHVTLHTLYFIESHNQGASMIPRLAGFATAGDKRFFELFTTCKGIGYRKALRAMTLPVGQIAVAIADRDAAVLQSLPEVGRRTAETIIATLRGKVDGYIDDPAMDSSVPSGDAQDGDAIAARPTVTIARQALDVLTQLGENRAAATNWVNDALREHDGPTDDLQTLLATVYRIKGGGGSLLE